jgi:hypothetical protein
VWIDAALANEFQLIQALKQGSVNFRALSYQHQYFRIFQTLGQLIDVLHMIVPDLYVMVSKFLEAGQSSQGIEVIVENRDVHFERAAISGFPLCENLWCPFCGPAKVSTIGIPSCPAINIS